MLPAAVEGPALWALAGNLRARSVALATHRSARHRPGIQFNVECNSGYAPYTTTPDYFLVNMLRSIAAAIA